MPPTGRRFGGHATLSDEAAQSLVIGVGKFHGPRACSKYLRPARMCLAEGKTDRLRSHQKPRAAHVAAVELAPGSTTAAE
jgi:hypothetical protein